MLSLLFQTILTLSIGLNADLGSSVAAPELDPRQHKKLLREFERDIRENSRQKTAPTNLTIRLMLEKLAFVEKPLPVFNLSIPQWITQDKTRQDYILDEIMDDQADEHFIPDRLNLIKVSYQDINHPDIEHVFYDPLHRALFINYQNPADHAQKLEEKIIQSVWTNETYARINKIRNQKQLDGTFAANDLPIIEAEVSQELEQNFPIESSALREIPPNILIARQEEIRRMIADDKEKWGYQFSLTKTNLYHEAFHYFYDYFIEREGYEGPSMAELLQSALDNSIERYGQQGPPYIYTYSGLSNPEFIDFFKEYADADEDTRIEMIEEIINSGFEAVPELTTRQQWRDFDSSLIGLIHFFNTEYWARVYNGALGYTDNSHTALLERQSRVRHADLPQKYAPDVTFVEPLEQEIEILRQMRWQEKSILTR